ncbi:hypothetical protein [Saccharomonospora cyanea]|uniref:Uncharacterized protein n=1 Tax=Saccharomonospora cyanea NA-134 TaxID=882082 RepID=H5XLA5_9PSEU|nr:hypothetical protein [Saccharomonospora cyanea]EHR63613.1 hypothetical protein SaccyDRAFT_4809 [Saccharomonospora cyanea NA-134]
MSGDFQIGDRVTQYGDHNIGINRGQQHTDAAAALRSLVTAVQLLRDQAPVEDRPALNDALRTIEAGQDAPRGALRRALATISGIAVMIGEVGGPVVEAVQGVKAVLGI